MARHRVQHRGLDAYIAQADGRIDPVILEVDKDDHIFFTSLQSSRRSEWIFILLIFGFTLHTFVRALTLDSCKP